MARKPRQENLEGDNEIMIHLYGHVSCSNCSKNIRALVEFQYEEEAFIMVGEPFPSLLKGQQTSVTCEYCFQPIQVTPLEQNGRFVMLANEIQVETYHQHPETIPTVKAGEGIKNELRVSADDVSVTCTLVFSQQPFHPNQHIYLKQHRYRVVHSYKKEHTEKETEERLLVDFFDTYYYEIETDDGTQKWLKVVDDSGDNAVLNDEPPVVLQYETLYNIDDSGFKSTHLYDLPLSDHYKASFYQHLSGVQMQIIYHDEHQSSIIVDALEQEIDELYKHIESHLHIIE